MAALFYWSGVLTWLVFALLGVCWLFDQASNWLVDAFWTRKEFLAFIVSRIKRKQG